MVNGMAEENLEIENNSSELDSDTITIGKFLKSEREKSGNSLKRISYQTKISITMLELLERDQLDDLLVVRTRLLASLKPRYLRRPGGDDALHTVARPAGQALAVCLGMGDRVGVLFRAFSGHNRSLNVPGFQGFGRIDQTLAEFVLGQP